MVSQVHGDHCPKAINDKATSQRVLKEELAQSESHIQADSSSIVSVTS